MTLDDEDATYAPGAKHPELVIAAARERGRRQRIATLQRVTIAAIGVACVALAGSYLVPGGGLRFSTGPERAEGWEEIPWDVCGSVRSFEELATAELDDEAMCAALLKARSYSGGDDEFFVLSGEVDPRDVQQALGADEPPDVADGSGELQLLLVRSPGNRFRQELPRDAQGRTDRVDAMAIWFPEDERPAQVDTMLLSSESDSYPALERLISR